MTIALRQPVLVVHDLEPSLAVWRDALGLAPGARDPEMAEFGLVHEVIGVGDETFLELVSPIRDDASAARHLARQGGDGGYMLALHVRDGDAEAFRDRARELGYPIVLESGFRGSHLVQFHPRTFGLLLQVSHSDRPWHWFDQLDDSPTGTIADAITALQIAVADPVAMTRTWADLLEIPVDDGATVLPLDQGTIEFVIADGRTGLVGLSVHSIDRSRAGAQLELTGVAVTFV